MTKGEGKGNRFVKVPSTLVSAYQGYIVAERLQRSAIATEYVSSQLVLDLAVVKTPSGDGAGVYE